MPRPRTHTIIDRLALLCGLLLLVLAACFALSRAAAAPPAPGSPLPDAGHPEKPPTGLEPAT